MDVMAAMKKICEFLKKYRYAAIILVIGIALMMIPSQTDKTAEDPGSPITKATEPTASVEEQLEMMLGYIEGVGRVEVMLTVSSGAETFYQTDDNITSHETGSTSQREVVTVTDSERNQQAVVKQINPQKYLGAVIVCQGADNPVIQLAIIDAVSKATGLDSNHISVLKMK